MKFQFPYLLICSLSFLVSCGKTARQEKQPNLPRPVKTVKVTALGALNRQYTGTVEAMEFSVLAFKLSGSVIEMNVRQGQQIKKGQVIARIDPSDYRLQYETAVAYYKTAKSIYERNARLYAANAIALQNLEISRADCTRAYSAVNLAQRALEYTVLKAPFSGFIEEKYADNFEEIQAGQAIVRLVNPERIEVRFTLPESNIHLLRLPRKIYVEFDSQKGKLFTSDIKDYVDASNGYGIPLILEISDEQFAAYRKNVYPGFSCKVIWETDHTIFHKFLIPPSALQDIDGKTYIWLVDSANSTVHRHEITVKRLNESILVESGLNNRDRIVTAGLSSLNEGEKVRLLKN